MGILTGIVKTAKKVYNEVTNNRIDEKHKRSYRWYQALRRISAQSDVEGGISYFRQEIRQNSKINSAMEAFAKYQGKDFNQVTGRLYNQLHNVYSGITGLEEFAQAREQVIAKREKARQEARKKQEYIIKLENLVLNEITLNQEKVKQNLNTL